ncbi:TetR family transcriptional regulator [Methyloprofundus sedimenti]|uniref:TetR family transcriptional regulator n=1 Tax=Methyloprofundus sedimenti TaxID=1420851 RepID=A0A1V8M3L4_9GAMM|nr:TetR/AcrR family transcriptional regulator [Methyloprofundus sedimenti]OQK16157.1 TetR family transcriptional regulator [Methyloprofundus sedimenti]
MSSKNLETRLRILEVTLQMLEENRGQGVRMADIAKCANVSRQAIYLHFASRAELLNATTKFLDERLDLDRRLAPSRAASSGQDRLALYVEFWGNYIPEIYGVAKALLLVLDSDDAAAAAWQERMAAMRHGCRAAIDMLHSEHRLASEWTPESATDVLCTMLSVANWENFTSVCGWSNQQYVERMKAIAERSLLKNESAP